MIDSPVVSDDAGEYLCNETLYRTLMKIDDNTHVSSCIYLYNRVMQRFGFAMH